MEEEMEEEVEGMEKYWNEEDDEKEGEGCSIYSVEMVWVARNVEWPIYPFT